jgi:small subunit ribosomal protein S6
MYIIRPTLTDEGFQGVIKTINELFENHGGRITEVDEWGIRELAYEIDDFKKGYYVKFSVEADNAAVSEYDRICNINEDIIRHILVKD